MRAARCWLGGLVLTLSVSVVVSGCGGGAGGTPAARAFAKQTPAAILSAAVQAMAHARSYRALGVSVQGSSGVQLRYDVVAPASVASFIGIGAQQGRLVLLGSGGYINANAAFWQSKDPSAPVGVADHWFRFTPAQVRGLAAPFLKVAPRAVATCLFQELRRHPRVLGTTHVDGQPAVQLEVGRTSISTKALTLWVAEAAPHFPLRFDVDAGYDAPQTAGCDSTLTDATGSETMTFSDWDSTRVAAPRAAFNLN